MAWFEKLTGFQETSYDQTRTLLEVAGSQLCSRVNGASYAIGQLELASLQSLRRRAAAGHQVTGQTRVRVVRADVRHLHQAPENTGALFQVASQFNLLEMASPEITPEQGVTRYECDLTQGPACAISAGAATICRNYFVPTSEGRGQTATRQLDGLADLGAALSDATKLPGADLWTMKNGYALGKRAGLDAISQYLLSVAPEQIDALRGKLRIGVHSDVEVTEAAAATRPRVSQALCSALPIAYSQVPLALWRTFAALVLEAAYEATLWAAVLNARRGASNIVFLTLVGGGAFGNPGDWIHAAMLRALRLVADRKLDVRLVSFGPPSRELLAIADAFR